MSPFFQGVVATLAVEFLISIIAIGIGVYYDSKKK